MKKNPSWAKLSRCQRCRGSPARSPGTLITGRASLQARDRGGGCSLCSLGSQDKSTVYFVEMETPEECPLERCPSPLSGLQIANSRPDHCRELSKNQKLWALLSPQHQRLCLEQAFCSKLLFFSPFHPALGITRSPPTPFKLISQPGDFKRLTNA